MRPPSGDSKDAFLWSKPSWWSTVSEFAQNPTRFIQERVAQFLVAGVIAAIEALTGRVRWVWGVIADAVGSAGQSVDYAFEGAGDALLDGLGVVPNLVETLGSSLGPVTGPIVVSVGGILLVLVLWEIVKRAPGTLWALYQAIPGT